MKLHVICVIMQFRGSNLCSIHIYNLVPFRSLENLVNDTYKCTIWCHSVRRTSSPSLSRQTSLVASGKLATKASPSLSDTLGTSPTFPTSVTLFTPYFIMYKIWLQGLM